MSMMLRRGMLLLDDVYDNSPVISEYGKYCTRSGDYLADDPNWCVTDWMYFNPIPSGSNIQIVDAFASQATSKTYQYQSSTGGFKDYYYGSNDFSEYVRTLYGVMGRSLYKIRWSIRIDNLDKCYAFCGDTGQIFFAGRNSKYYGRKNAYE